MARRPTGQGASRLVGAAGFQALAKFRQSLRHYLAFAEKAAAGEGITPQQYQVLLAIKGSPHGDRFSVGMLAEAMQIAPHTALELARRLQAAGLLSILPDPSDGRRRLLAPTRSAENLLARLTSEHLAELEEKGALLLTVLSAVVSARPPPERAPGHGRH